MQETKPKIDINKKYKTRDGRPVRILCTDRKSDSGKYPIAAMVTFDNLNEVCAYYTVYGSYYNDSEADLDLIEVQPWEDFKIDDPVLVSGDGRNWSKRYFAGVNRNGLPTTFNDGTTSFTVPHLNHITGWKYCKKPEQE